MMERGEYLHLRIENLQSKSKSLRLSSSLEETKPSEIVKCKSRNGASVSDRMNLFYLTEVLIGKFD